MQQGTQTALILGATKGLGQQLFCAARARGWRAIGVGSSAVPSRSDDEVWVRSDLDQGQDMDALIEFLDNEELLINHFFWVAAVFEEIAFFKQDLGRIERMWRINYHTPKLLVQWLWTKMLRSKQPAFFSVISSTSGILHVGRPYQAEYAATKAAQVQFVRSLVGENSNPQFLKLSLFEPGGMRTEFYRNCPGMDTSQFMDPAKVAPYMLERVASQKESFLEEAIERDRSEFL